MTARKNCASRDDNTPKRVLIIDDDGAVRDSLKKVLEAAGYSVATAQDGREGINRLRAGALELLLLDLDLPILSGWDVLDLVRTEVPLLPVIILTGELHQCERGAFLSTDVVLEKPCDADVLLKALEKVMAESEKRHSLGVGGALAGAPAVPAAVMEDVARFRKLTGTRSL